ncbi:unnamed protein product [Orchesella dallaii]|uniref:Uncharacterized protein n=1 Tax=Orchesella dallaii TaxID=48710 RepID=A0ABP1RSJ4_9HEXA
MNKKRRVSAEVNGQPATRGRPSSTKTPKPQDDNVKGIITRSKTYMVALKVQHAEEMKDLRRKGMDKSIKLELKVIEASQKVSDLEQLHKTNLNHAATGLNACLSNNQLEVIQLKKALCNKISHLEHRLKKYREKISKYEASEPAFQSTITYFRQRMSVVVLYFTDFPAVQARMQTRKQTLELVGRSLMLCAVDIRKKMEEELAQLITKLETIFTSFQPVQVYDLCD